MDAPSIAQMRVERALWSLQRRTAGRTPTRDERRLEAHYLAQLRDHDNPEGDTP